MSSVLVFSSLEHVFRIDSCDIAKSDYLIGKRVLLRRSCVNYGCNLHFDKLSILIILFLLQEPNLDSCFVVLKHAVMIFRCASLSYVH